MAGDLLTLSTTEMDKLMIIARLAEGRMTQAQAATSLQKSVRQVRRMLRSWYELDRARMRDDFTTKTKQELAARAGYVCSNPECAKPTSGPKAGPSGAVNLGVAAHIAGASPGGKRYVASMTSKERSAAANGIWLCQDCGHLVDSDEKQFTLSRLHSWKARREAAAADELGSKRTASEMSASAPGGIATVGQIGDNLMVHGRPKVVLLDSKQEKKEGHSRYTLYFGNKEGLTPGAVRVEVRTSASVFDVGAAVGVIPAGPGVVVGAVAAGHIEKGVDADGKGVWVQTSTLGGGNYLSLAFSSATEALELEWRAWPLEPL